jgi:hypothetical protein
MAHDRHGELAAAAGERALDPCRLSVVERAQHAGVDREQREILGLQFEERRSLGADVDAVLPTQARRVRHQLVDAASIRAGQSEVGLDTRCYRRPRGVGLEEVGIEPFQRIIPVVIAGNCVDRLGEAMKGKIKIGFVIMHRSRGIDDVGRYDEKLHVVAQPQFQVARDQRILRRVAFAGIADDEKAEIPSSFQAARIDAKDIVAAAAVDACDGVGHFGAPGINPQLCHLLIDAGRPAFRVEIPAEPPDRVEGHEKGGHRQAQSQHQDQRGRKRGTCFAQPHSETEAALDPPADQPIRRAIHRRDASLGAEVERPR